MKRKRRAKKSCFTCKGAGYTVRWGKKYNCPWCYPAPGREHTIHTDKGEKVIPLGGNDGKA